MAPSPADASLRYVIVDVFTRERFKGNQLAIVEMPLEGSLDNESKQRIAREFNLSETVFLHPQTSEASQRAIDIFTTTQELPFAGHPTIGTLVYLSWGADSVGQGATQSFTLQTKAGLINAELHVPTGVAEASIPHNVRIHRKPVPWQSILNGQPSLKSVGDGPSSSCPLVSIVKGMTFVLVNVLSVEELAALSVGGPRLDLIDWDQGWESFTAPYFYAIVSENRETRHISVRVRMIEPGCGEDPATGSAASALSAYLALQRGTAGSTYSFSIGQGIEMGRHSEIGVKVTLNNRGDGVSDVVLSGSGVLVSEGRLYL
ncbi:MAG: hypothetical protein Q9209_005334 [Squamulea sp. 1 TL-2023]